MACIVELKMTADGEGGNAATAWQPKAEQGQKQPVAILDLALLAIVGRQHERGVHELYAEVKRLQRRDEAIESIRGPSAGG